LDDDERAIWDPLEVYYGDGDVKFDIYLIMTKQEKTDE
jgi:hypothetical protein